MKWLLTVLVIFGIIFVPSNFARAETTSTTISVTPAVLDISLKPGDVLDKTITIQNGNQQSIPISVSATSFTLNNIFDSTLSEYDYDASDWIKISTPQQILSPNERIELPIQIKIPENATYGGHYAQINVRALSLEKNDDKSRSIVLPEVSVGVLINVLGDSQESLQIISNNIFPWQSTPSDEHDISVLVKNNGNTHSLASPVLVISKNGQELDRKPFVSKIVFPGTTTKFTMPWSAPKNPGIYDLKIDLSYATPSKIEASKRERLLISPSVIKIIIFDIFTLIILFLFKNRKNIKKAIDVLKTGQ